MLSFLQHGGVGPMQGQAGHFTYASEKMYVESLSLANQLMLIFLFLNPTVNMELLDM